jgi:hypothetical protein
MEAKILYKTDHWHSYSSRDLIGVFTNRQTFIRTIRKLIKDDLKDRDSDENETYTEAVNWQVDFFLNHGQTHGLQNFEIVSETIDLNTIQ